MVSILLSDARSHPEDFTYDAPSLAAQTLFLTRANVKEKKAVWAARL